MENTKNELLYAIKVQRERDDSEKPDPYNPVPHILEGVYFDLYGDFPTLEQITEATNHD